MKVFIICVLYVTAILADENALREFTTANNLFAVSTYQEFMEENEGNFLISPLSAEIAFAFAQSGARGNTGKELRKALHLPNNNTQIESGVERLLSQLKGHGNYTMNIANKLYVNEKYAVRHKFEKTAAEVYKSGIENINFGNEKKAAKRMNSWVEEQTNNKIHDIIDPNNLNKDIKIVIINALYFKAKWLTPLFPGRNKMTFYTTAQKSVNVDMMYDYDAYISYYENPLLNAKFIELPFKGEDAFMTIVLPNKKEEFDRLENNLDQVFIPHKFKETFVKLILPKFKIETTVDFKDILKKLDVHEAFSPSEADFSGITDCKRGLVIDEVIQKTFIDVNEKGVEAAVSTAILNVVQSAFIDTKEFIADHPFIFYIKVKNVIVFTGRVTNPISK